MKESEKLLIQLMKSVEHRNRLFLLHHLFTWPLYYSNDLPYALHYLEYVKANQN